MSYFDAPELKPDLIRMIDIPELNPDLVKPPLVKPKMMPPRAGMGRPMGSKNKFTTTLKEAILASFDRVGGIDYLEKQARENPQAYMSLLAKVLPMQITGPNDGPIMLITGVIRSDEEAEIFERQHRAIDSDHDPDDPLSGRTSDWPLSHTGVARPEATRADTDADTDAHTDADASEPAVETRSIGVGMTSSGLLMREVAVAPPTHICRTMTTESGLRIRMAVPED